MKCLLLILVLAACAVPFIQATKMPQDIDHCVVVKKGNVGDSYVTTYLDLPEEMVKFRVIVNDPPVSMIKIVGSEINVCDVITPEVRLSKDEGSYLIMRDPSSSNGGFYQLTVYYAWNN